MRAEVARLRAALETIVGWAEAYPASIYPEPTKEQFLRANELLGAHSMRLDAFGGSVYRDALRGVADICRRALEGE